MYEASAGKRPAPNGILLGLSAFAVTGVAGIAWLLIALGTLLSDWRWDDGWIYSGLALPAATIGAVIAYSSGRHRYFWIGLAITLIPLLIYVVLAANEPPPPAEGWD